MPKSTSPRRRAPTAAVLAEYKQTQDIGYALLGRAFAKAMKDAPEDVKKSALELEEWMVYNALSPDEADDICNLTGFTFDAPEIPF